MIKTIANGLQGADMVYLGADHGGFPLKESLKTWLTEWNVRCEDCGALQLQADDDYPDYAFAVATKVAEEGGDSVGILLCRSGGGMVVAANKVKGVRAVMGFDEKSAVHARTHDHANVLALAADWIDEEDARSAVKAFLATAFDMDERHVRRINKINDYEMGEE